MGRGPCPCWEKLKQKKRSHSRWSQQTVSWFVLYSCAWYSLPSSLQTRMSTLFLVRHGQASFLERNYDKLSTKGETQARMLGEYWAGLNLQFDCVYSGPRVRQRETAR